MADEAVRRRMGKIAFHVHPESRVGVYLRNFEVTVSSERPVGRSQMVRLSLPGAVLDALRPYAREQAAALGGQRPTQLTIDTELGSGELPLGGDLPPHQVRLPAARLAEILFGYRTAEELRDIHGLHCRTTTPRSWMRSFRRLTPTATGPTATKAEILSRRGCPAARPIARTHRNRPAASAPCGRARSP